jgi:hypothetical protein
MAAKHQEEQAGMKEQILDIPTRDGAIETFVCHRNAAVLIRRFCS